MDDELLVMKDEDERCVDRLTTRRNAVKDIRKKDSKETLNDTMKGPHEDCRHGSRR